MNDAALSVDDLGFDPEAIRRKYLEEAAKRRPAAGTPRRPAFVGGGPVPVEDPYADADPGRAPLTDEVDVIVVGGGFAGLVTGAQLRSAGVRRVRLIEKGAGFGGVWYWNRYPGIRCDVESYVYLPKIEEVGTMPSRRFAHGDEIRAHCEAMAKAYDLDELACLRTQVTGMRWDDAARRWIVTTDRGDEMRARFVCLGSGTLDVPSIPDVPGLGEFTGHVFHSSRWDYGYTGGDAQGGLTGLADKRVAVVGTAASAIQFIPHLAAYARHVTVFQRTPMVVVPRENQATDPEWFRNRPRGWQRERMENLTAVVQSPPGVQPPERDLLDDALTNLIKRSRTTPPQLAATTAGADRGTQMLLTNYWVMEQVRAEMASLVDDPDTAEALKPYYNMGCKRPQFSSDYLRTYNRPNVTLVDTQGQGIERLTPTGVVVGGVEHEADCVIFATGFAVNAGAFPVAGRDGRLLSDRWAGGVRSLHGILTAGFPNLFVVGSIPQSAHAVNFTHLLDAQADHVATIVSRCVAGSIESVDVRPAAEDRWAAEIDSRRAELPPIDLGCVPDSAANLFRAAYPGGPIEYMRICRDWLADGFDRDLIPEPRSAAPAP